jgi:large subunit ribosomal protein L21
LPEIILAFSPEGNIFAVRFQMDENVNTHETMYAIVDIAGKQFKVEKDRYIYAPALEGHEGDAVKFDRVLLLDVEGDIRVGAPTVSGAVVTGKILAHVKGDKVIVFKKKRRKGYRKKNGHRQAYTKVLIEDIK